MPPKSKAEASTRATEAIVRPTPNPTPKTVTPPQKADPRRVAAVAYRLYEERGRKDGHDVQDWIRAEQIVKAEQVVRQESR